LAGRYFRAVNVRLTGSSGCTDVFLIWSCVEQEARLGSRAMGAWASALPPLSVDPGEEVTCLVQVRNTGVIVDQFTFEVLGDAARWARVEPESLSLFPGAQGEVTLGFKPPRVASTPAGTVPFGLKVFPHEDPEGVVVEENTLEIGRFSDGFAELVPRTSRGRFAARHELAFDNKGNGRASAELSGIDPDDLLRFHFSPPELNAQPGTATFARVRVQPRKRFFLGPSRTRPFNVVVAEVGADPVTLDGTMLQEALVPRWLVPALLALGALAVLWALLLQPHIESTARDAVKQPLAAQAQQVAAAQQSAADAQKTANAALGQNSNTGGGSGQSAGLSGNSSAGTATGERLHVTCPSHCNASFVVPAGRSFSLTDLVLQNPDGNSGTLTLRRGNAAVLSEGLANFRDLDYHFVAPLILRSRQRLAVEVRCRKCSPAVYFAGFLSKQATKRQ
jgi:hypothetical protein